MCFKIIIDSKPEIKLIVVHCYARADEVVKGIAAIKQNLPKTHSFVASNVTPYLVCPREMPLNYLEELSGSRWGVESTTQLIEQYLLEDNTFVIVPMTIITWLLKKGISIDNSIIIVRDYFTSENMADGLIEYMKICN